MRNFLFILVLFLTFSTTVTYAQLNNQALEKKLEIKPEYDQDLRFGLDVLGFNRNNEYFNDIADGYTLFGYHLNPKLVYFPSEFIRLEAGALLWKDFGTNRYNRVLPTFTLKLQKEHYQFLFGNLQASVSHRYIEPLYDFERLISNPLENGVQFICHRDKLYLDAWIDWQRMIYRGDPFQEEIAGGLSAEERLWENENGWRVGLPFQFTAKHRGGQIDAATLPLVTLFNGAVGLKVEKKLPFTFWKAFRTENYFLVYQDFSHTRLSPFTSGNGVYLNLGVDTKVQNVLLSYWRGNGYISEPGGQLFQSASRSFSHPDYLEKQRELLILRFSKDFQLAEDLTLTLRFEPLYDFTTPQLEFSHGLYLHFNTDFFITKLKK